MATIDAFQMDKNGNYAGAITTLILSVEKAELRKSEKDNDKAPDYLLFAGETEIGAAWRKTSRENRHYLSVKLDDPSFPAPIYASLVDVPEGEPGSGFSLIWSRSRQAD